MGTQFSFPLQALSGEFKLLVWMICMVFSGDCEYLKSEFAIESAGVSILIIELY
jgi:hypothetical protein